MRYESDDLLVTPPPRSFRTSVRRNVPYLKDSYGNPSSVYDLGVANKSALLTARKRIAKTLNCAKPQNIYFTSGGTESDNWAIIGTAEQCKKNGNHIITSKIEHHAVLNTCAYLEERGFEITYLDVDEQGFIKPEKLLQWHCVKIPFW